MTIMKNFYKNLIGVMAVATVLLGGATLAHADSVTVIPSLGIDTSTAFNFIHAFYFFEFSSAHTGIHTNRRN